MGNAVSTRRVVYLPHTDAQQITDELMNGAMGALAMGGEQAPWHVYAEARDKRNRWLRWIRQNLANLDVGYGRTPPGMPDIEAMALENLPPLVNATLESRVLQLGNIPHGSPVRFKCGLCGETLYTMIWDGADDLGNLHGDANLHLMNSVEAACDVHLANTHSCTVRSVGQSQCPIHPNGIRDALAPIQDVDEQGDELARRLADKAARIAAMNGFFGLVPVGGVPDTWRPQGLPMNTVMPIGLFWDEETGQWEEKQNSLDMQRCKERTSMLLQLHQAFECLDTRRIFCTTYLNVKCWFPRMSILLKAWIFFQRLWLVPQGMAALNEDAMRHIIMQYMRLVFKEIAVDLRITPLVVGTLLSIECLRPTFQEQASQQMTEPRLFANWLGIELQKQQMAMRFVNLPNVMAWERITSPSRL